MKLPILLFSLSILPLVLMAQDNPGIPNASSQFGAALLPVWARAAAYTLEVAEAMPEEHYGMRNHDSTSTFGAQLLHVANNILHISSKLVREEDFPDKYGRESADTLSKADIIERLNFAFAYGTETLELLSDENWHSSSPPYWGGDAVPKMVTFLLTRDHMTHHRGQLIVMLRDLGMVPPRYRGW